MIEQNMLTQISDLIIDKAHTNDHRRKQLLACLRNTCFEYEDYEADFDQMDLVGKLVKILVQEQGITSLPSRFDHLKEVAPKELFQSQINMANTREILDALVLLCNSDKFLRNLYDNRFDIILKCIKCPAFGETQTKVDTIGGQLASVEMDDPKLVTDADEEEKEAAIEEAKEETKTPEVAKPAAIEVIESELD